MLRVSLLLLLAAVAAVAGVRAGEVPTIKVDPPTHMFVDSHGRTTLLRGFNAVEKVAPWYPKNGPTEYDGLDSLNARDARNMQEWGFNFVRLGLMWPGVEPEARGEYNYTYLQEIADTVDLLAERGVYVLLDMHQDLLSRRFCGEGVPDWVADICQDAEPEGTAAFPRPVVDEDYPADADGNPDLDTCLQQTFAAYYLTAEVSFAFQCIYDNIGGVQDALGDMWYEVGKFFKDKPSVVGIEFINEPWAGDIFADPSLLIKPGKADLVNLQPMYQNLNARYREADDEKLVFYESVVYDYWPVGFDSTPGGPEYDDRQVLSWHDYCWSTKAAYYTDRFCERLETYFANQRQEDVDRLGGGWMLTEFGALADSNPEITHLENDLAMADDLLQSWAYWQYKAYNDLTTVSNYEEGLYQNGSLSAKKLYHFSRTYAQSTAGVPTSMSFDPPTGAFSLKYEYKAPADLTDETARTTVIYANQRLHYTRGMDIQVTPEDGSIEITQDGNYFSLVHDDTTPDGAEIAVTISHASA